MYRFPLSRAGTTQWAAMGVAAASLAHVPFARNRRHRGDGWRQAQ